MIIICAAYNWFLRSTDGQCLKEVLERLARGNNLQQRNAIDVISELVQISLKSADGLPHLAWYKDGYESDLLIFFAIIKNVFSFSYFYPS